METVSFAVGVDLGGTTIKAGSVDAEGTILHQIAIASHAAEGPQAVIQQLRTAIEEILGKHPDSPCIGIGVGSPGVVTNDGFVKHPPNFAGWNELALANTLGKSFPLRVVVENDANVAAIAESRFGAGKEVDDFLFVIWGTGVGGGIIMNRAIFRGSEGGAGEIGHVSIDYNGPQCNCGSRGCVESYIGQRYLSERTIHTLNAQGQGSTPSKIIELVGGNMSKIEPSIISQAADQGDQLARNIMVEAGTFLGYALASILNVLDLRVVIIGGGISAAQPYVYEAIESALRSRVLKPYKSDIRVIRAKLGNTAGIVGAASLVM